MPLIQRRMREIPVDGGFVKKLSIFAVSVLAALIGLSGSALSQSAQILPLPDSPVATDIPGARVLHQGGTEMILNNAAFKARNDGHDNPNTAMIRSMKKAGIDFRVCGQAVLGRKIETDTIMPEIELDLWALTTITNLELRGYIHVAGN